MFLTRLLVASLSALLVLPAFAAEEDWEQERAAPSSGITGRYLLMDSNGRAVSNEDFPGRFQLISFGYTFCPDICPTTLAEMALVMSHLGSDAERLQPVFITVDPERDTAKVLRTYVTFFHPRMIGLRGSPALIRRAADNFRVRYEKVREPGAPPEEYAVDHSAGMFLLGPDGSYIRKFAYGVPPAEIGDGIREIIAAGDNRAAIFNRRTTR